MKRTLTADTINEIGSSIMLQGWIDARRDHGKIVFLDLRDRTGTVQCVIVNAALAENVRSECVVQIQGAVKKRPESMVNSDITTGTVEIEVSDLTILSSSKELPIPIDTDGYDIDEEVRMKWRYLDLRRPRMTENIRFRSKMTQFIRDHLTTQDFIEIETPILTKSTPEGARDFLVPSRLQPGNFYALPQSPQQYKQLLMVSGFEKYFQIARVFRDEDPRRDRAYGEFTQLDIEMSFVTQEDILAMTEKMFTDMVAALFPQKKMTASPWPRLSHAEAMKQYRSDRPDLRNDTKDPDELAFAWVVDFPLFTKQSKDDYFHGAGEIYAPSHHMFTAPHPDDVKLLDTKPEQVRGLQHDLVLNGFEVGGGSIRIHDNSVQEKIFDLIGFTPAQKKQFDHMLTAFSYGVPPHGGIAPGIDRLLFALLGEPSLREVVAFPATSGGKTAVMNAPSKAADEQLKELHITTHD